VRNQTPTTPKAAGEPEKKAQELEALVKKAKEQYREQIEGTAGERAAEGPSVGKAEVLPQQPKEEIVKPPTGLQEQAKPQPAEAETAAKAKLPLTPTEIEVARRLPLYDELRWLGEWCTRQIYKFTPGKFNERVRESLQMVFFEVLLPRDNEIEPSAADQMFANLAGLYKGGFMARFGHQHTISLEIVADANEIRFIVGTPVALSKFVTRQIHASYPCAEIIQIPEYNIFGKEGAVEAAVLEKTGPPYFSLLTYGEDLPVDPLNSLTQSLSRLQEEDTAAIQICISPTGPWWQKKGQAVIFNSQNPAAESLPKAFISSFGRALTGRVQEPVSEKAPVRLNEKVLEGIQKKISKPGFNTIIRVVVTAGSRAAAKTHLNNIVSSFEQFSNPHLSSFRRRGVLFRKHLMIDYLYRYTPRWKQNILSSAELATVFHFPNKNVQTPDIKWLLAKSAAPPQNLPTEGLFLGLSTFRNEEKKIYIREDDRRRHIYIIGQTGTGKTELMKHLVYQDIVAGRGLAFIDPHGDAVREVLSMVPEERVDDVIYFNPGDYQYPPGLNILEAKSEEGKHLIINSFIALLYKLYDPNRTGIMGPRLERALRNVMLTAMSEEGNTLVEVLRLLIDPDFANSKVPLIKDPLVKMYWTEELAKTSDFHKSEVLGYFVSKFDRFVTEKLMRNIVGQSKSSFDFREVMDQEKVLLVDLSKGKIGEENSNFLGLILIPRILAAAMSRADIPQEKRKDFYLYVDEFQNFTTPDFVTILSEARKYRLNLTVANQFISQLPDEIKGAVFGNVGTSAFFRVGPDDAEFLEHQVEPFFTKSDLMSNPVGTCYTRLLISGQPSVPFSMKTDWNAIQAIPRSEERAQQIIALSRKKYGRPADEVDAEIRARSNL